MSQPSAVEPAEPKTPTESKPRSFVRDAGTVVGTKVWTLLISFITATLLARWLGPEGKGLIAAVMVFPSMLLSVADLGVRQASIYFIGKKVYPFEKIVGVLTFAWLFVTIVGSAAALGLMMTVGHDDAPLGIMLLAAGSLPLTLLTTYANGIFLGNQMVGVMSRITRMTVVQTLLVSILLVYVLGMGVAGAMLATILGQVVASVYALSRLLKLAPIRPHWDGKLLIDLVSKGVLYSLSMFVMKLNYSADLILMQRLTTLEQIGLYTVGVSIAQLIWMVPTVLSSVVFSRSANAKDPEAFSRNVAKLYRVISLFGLLVLGFLFFTMPYILPLLYGEKFATSVPVMQILLVGVWAMVATKTINGDFAGRGRPLLMLAVMLPSLILNIGLNLYLLPRYGAIGAAYASSVTYTLSAIGVAFQFSRVSGIPMWELVRYRRSDFDFMDRLIKKLRRR
jgi:O-antigen/teichoic acid export membrane protein